MDPLVFRQVIFLGVIAFLPVLMWFFLWRYKDHEKEPFRAMLMTFGLGMLATVPFLIVQEILKVTNSQLELFGLAFVEEIIKALVLVLAIELSHRWFTQIVDGLIYGAVIGLGFAFIENIFYFLPLFDPLVGEVNRTAFFFSLLDPSFPIVYTIRSFNTMVAHTLFTALFGFFYASAYLRKDIFPEKKKEKPWHHFFKNIGEALPLHVTLFHLLPNRPSKHGHYPGSLILEGILVAGLLHGLFNLLFQVEVDGVSLGFLSFPFVCLIAYGVWRMFLQEFYVRVVRKVKG